MSKFKIFEGTNGQFYFRLVAANGQTILQSEGYTTKQNCNNGIESAKSNASDDRNYRRLTATNGQHYFTLVAPNNQVVGTSETYTTMAAREEGVAIVKRNAPFAPTEDTTVASYFR